MVGNLHLAASLTLDAACRVTEGTECTQNATAFQLAQALGCSTGALTVASEKSCVDLGHYFCPRNGAVAVRVLDD